MAQKQTLPALACNLDAISAAERPRYSALAKRVKDATSERHELSNGYRFVLRPVISLPEVAEWVSFERLCCPFLSFQLEVSGLWHLQLTGPEGAKAILNEAFPAPAN